MKNGNHTQSQDYLHDSCSLQAGGSKAPARRPITKNRTMANKTRSKIFRGYGPEDFNEEL